MPFKNKSDPSTDPWDTPASFSHHWEASPLMTQLFVGAFLDNPQTIS